MELKLVPLELPPDSTIIVALVHDRETVEAMAKAITAAAPDLPFGYVYHTGGSGGAYGGFENAWQLAGRNADAIGARHTLVLVHQKSPGVNVLGLIRNIGALVNVFCASSERVSLLVASTSAGCAILGAIAIHPGYEDDAARERRHRMLAEMGQL